MEERLDIFNPDGEKTGESQTYADVHLRGLLHRTVHVWLMNSRKEFLLQKRSKDKRAYPDYWDVSAAGHIASGETSLRAAQRETQEELGVNLADSEFMLLATIRQPLVKHSDTFIDNELNDIYLVRCDLPLSEFKLAADEVQEMKWVGKEELLKWLRGEEEKLVPHEEEYRILLAHL